MSKPVSDRGGYQWATRSVADEAVADEAVADEAEDILNFQSNTAAANGGRACAVA